MRATGIIALLLLVCPLASGQQAQKSPVIWQGQIHLGDNPEAYTKFTSAGMCMQVPFKANASKKYRLTVKVVDVQTRAGDGHYVEVFAHYREELGGKETKTPTLQGTFRIKDDTDKEKDFSFEVVLDKGHKEEPTFFSVRIRVDTTIPLGLWDDFLVKEIRVEEIK